MLFSQLGFCYGKIPNLNRRILERLITLGWGLRKEHMEELIWVLDGKVRKEGMKAGRRDLFGEE